MKMALHANEEADAQVSKDDDNLETSPLAFTVHFDDPKPESRKLKIHDKLSSFALKHRRNPSLPDFKAVRTAKSLETAELVPTLSHVNATKLNKQFALPKAGYHSEGYFSSDQDEESIKLKSRQANMLRSKISPVTEDRRFVPHMNGASVVSKPTILNNLRRNSLNDIEIHKMAANKTNILKLTRSDFEVEHQLDENDPSDTVSEAGTYTVDKDEVENELATDLNKTITLEDNNEYVETSNVRKILTPENHKWINDWVKKVAEENFLNPPKEPPSQLVDFGSGSSSSASASKVTSPVNTMPKIKEPLTVRRSERSLQPKVNGTHHRRSSSLSSKDFSEQRASDSSLETESYLRTTESVMTAMQNRMKSTMKLNLNNDSTKKCSGRKERIHPPSTASDTDTNSETESKGFKKAVGAPFTSARLNRAFSLRRARADLEAENVEKDLKKRTSLPPPAAVEKRTIPNKGATSPMAVKPKPPASAPFSRTDCGRFSMRSTASVTANKTSPCAVPKKDNKKATAGGRSNSSLSSREVEFQNWKRRKSFDPMKAAAEGRKKEAAKKAAMTQSLTHGNLSPSASMTQSVNLGTTVQTRSGNPVLRSASFHVSPLQPEQPVDIEDDISPEEEEEEEEDLCSAESSCLSRQPTLPPNSPTRTAPKTAMLLRGGVAGSRGSLNSAISETHSSPSRRARAEFIDNLLVSTISDLSIKLRFKSSHLLKKLDNLFEGDDRLQHLREEFSFADSQKGSANSSPSRRNNTRDFPGILKNLKSVESVLQALDDVLFGDERFNDD